MVIFFLIYIYIIILKYSISNVLLNEKDKYDKCLKRILKIECSKKKVIQNYFS